MAGARRRRSRTSGCVWQAPSSAPRRKIDAVRHKIADLGGPVHYIDFGGAGPAILMVHGLGGNALNWMAVGPELAKRYHAIAIDLAGFRQTPLHRRSATVGANPGLVQKVIDQVIREPRAL